MLFSSSLRTSLRAASRSSSWYAKPRPILPHSSLLATRKFCVSPRCHDTVESIADTKQKEHTQSVGKRKAVRSQSLRRVAVEAERSRDAVKSASSKVEQEAEVKTVTAYCAAERYDISKVSRVFKNLEYDLDPHVTALYPQVVHIQVPHTSRTPDNLRPVRDHPQADSGDVFVFPSGTLVAWNVTEETATRILSNIAPASVNPLPVPEEEDLEFTEDFSSDKSTIIGERIRLGIAQKDPADTSTSPQSLSSTDITLAKVAFSSGLARSAKLAVLESALDRYFESTRTIPSLLSAGSKIPFTRSFTLRKTGELLHVRAQLNLYSELTDSLPDLFWESRHELGLEGYFDNVGRALDVNIRIRTLNEKIGHAQEILVVLREKLSERHGLLLEWLIIALIAIEVVFGSIHMYEEYTEKNDRESTEALLRQYLRKQLKDE
jgi:uncharacterized Rmd1/YagE family protein